jgi:MFS transporter, DHA1 family, tetracycline resistance protein
MNKNLRILLLVSVLFGLATGIYDLALPYYLHEKQVSFHNMGIIFAVAALVIFLIRIYVSHLSDISGRKLFFSLAILGSAVANLLTPVTASVAIQSILKTLRETSFVVKETIQSVLIYEHDKKGYTDWIGKIRGLEYCTEGAGTLIVGLFLFFSTYQGSLLFAGGLLVVGCIIFIWKFAEPKDIESEEETPIPNHKRLTVSPFRGVNLKIPHPRLFSYNLPRELVIIAIAGFITGIGTSTSHCFVMPLFFAQKFQASTFIVSIIMALHRVVLALPMIFVSKFINRNLKWIYIWFLALQSVAISATALMPNLWLAAVVWFIHDLVGGGIWAPAYYALIQQHSRSETRALDTSKVMALNQLGWVVGPLLAGWLFPISSSYPFFFGGLISLSSVFILLKL